MSGKKQRERLIRLAKQHRDWVLGFADEVWWSRLAQPDLHTWPPDHQALRLIEKTLAKDDDDPKALACCGVRGRDCQSRYGCALPVASRSVS